MTTKQLGILIRYARENFNEKRKAEGHSAYTQADIAEALGVSKKAVGDWERGTAQPKSLHLIRLCSFLGLTVDEFLGVKKNAFCSM